MATNKENTVTKTELISYIKEALQEDGMSIRKDQVSSTVNYMIDAIKDFVYDGKTVRISGFATFEPVEVPERNVFGKPVPAHTKVKAMVSSSWKNLPEE